MRRIFLVWIFAFLLSGCVVAQMDVTTIPKSSAIQAIECSEAGFQYILVSALKKPVCIRKGHPLAIDVSGKQIFSDGTVTVVWLGLLVQVPQEGLEPTTQL